MRTVLFAVLLFGCADAQVITRIPKAPPNSNVVSVRKDSPREKRASELPLLEENNQATRQLYLKTSVKALGVTIKTREGRAGGIVLTPDGLILTCRHCVEGEDEIILKVTDQNDKQVDLLAKIVDLDDKNDLALIRVLNLKGEFPNTAILDDVDDLAWGDRIYTIANPLDHGEGLFQGTVVNLDYEYSDDKDIGKAKNGMRISVDIAPGSSGFPLFASRNGKLCAVNVAVDRLLPRIGVAVPMRAIKPFLDKNKVRYRTK